jgi:hypothetical protein
LSIAEEDSKGAASTVAAAASTSFVAIVKLTNTETVCAVRGIEQLAATVMIDRVLFG